MFRFTQEPSSGSYNQCLVKITSLVQQCVSVQTLSVLRWRQCYGRICDHNTENIYNNMYTGARNVILAKHRL